MLLFMGFVRFSTFALYLFYYSYYNLYNLNPTTLCIIIIRLKHGTSLKTKPLEILKTKPLRPCQDNHIMMP